MQGRSLRRAAGLSLAVGVLLAPVSAAQAPGVPAVRVLGDDLEARSSFGPGERMAVEGTGFPANTTVTVTFEAGDAVSELGTEASRDDGSFLARARVPKAAGGGAATVRASAGGVSATAAVGIDGEDVPAEPAAALWPWAVALAAIAAYGSVVWRGRGPKRQATGERGPRRADTEEAPVQEPVPRAGAKKEKERSDRVRKLSDDVSAWTRDPR